MVEHLTFTR